MRRWDTPGRQHRPAKRKRQGENRVLPLDHLQRDAQVVENRHDSIVIDPKPGIARVAPGPSGPAAAPVSSLGSWVLGLGSRVSGLEAFVLGPEARILTFVASLYAHRDALPKIKTHYLRPTFRNEGHKPAKLSQRSPQLPIDLLDQLQLL